jgi:hypothetical protein
MENLGKIKRDREHNKVDEDTELEHFIELANNAAKYKKYMDAVQNEKATTDMLEKINESIMAIERVMPEVKRMRKE